jgi:tripartite-type tricarboxylate transporter receptor subunit TctC
MRLIQILATMAAFLLTGINAASADDFYKGKTITIVVGYAAGGGFDATARLVARYIAPHIPGEPTVIVQNMPGAGSATSVMYLNTSAPKDGTYMSTFNFGVIGNSVIQPDKTRIDFRKFNWIGSVAEDLSVCVTWSALHITNLDQLKQHGTVHFGVTAFGGGQDINEKIVKNLFGVDMKQVSGYPGTAEMHAATERGELDGGCDSWSSLPEDWITNHRVDPLTRSTDFQPKNMPTGVPFLVDLAGTDRDRQIVRLLTASGDLGRPFITSALVPADRVKILRDAFDAAIAEPGFLADAEKQQLPVSPKHADEAIKIVDALYATPPDIVAAGREVLAQ